VVPAKPQTPQRTPVRNAPPGHSLHKECVTNAHLGRPHPQKARWAARVRRAHSTHTNPWQDKLIARRVTPDRQRHKRVPSAHQGLSLTAHSAAVPHVPKEQHRKHTARVNARHASSIHLNRSRQKQVHTNATPVRWAPHQTARLAVYHVRSAVTEP
jgi:hypothetical protein